MGCHVDVVFGIFVLLNVKSIETKSELYESEIDLGSEMDLWLTIFFFILHFRYLKGKEKSGNYTLDTVMVDLYYTRKKSIACRGLFGWLFFFFFVVKFCEYSTRSHINDVTD